MCGICGYFHFSSSKAIKKNQEILSKMGMPLAHRGPDGSGTFIDRSCKVGLGHRRLAVIDLSPGGSQPMSSDDGSLTVVFNGEIYNYRELREELNRLGHSFRSKSDTEILIHGYEEWGVLLFKKLVGMFAFAIWDEHRKELTLCRDHFGIKPLYYTVEDDVLLFSSETKSLLEGMSRPAEVDEVMIYDFLMYTRQHSSESTFLKGIKKIRPGSFVQFRDENKDTNAQISYWRPDLSEIHTRYDYSQPVETFRRLFEDSISLQLRSDVAIGAFLSGGIDSSAIVAEAYRQTGTRLNTFSVWYDEPGFQEKHFMQLVANNLPVIPHFISPTPETFWTSLGEFVKFQEFPTIGPGPFSEFCVSKIAKGVVTVIYTGQGPDEILAGYDHCFIPFLRTRLRELPHSISDAKQWSRDIIRTLPYLRNVPPYQLAGILPFGRELIPTMKKKMRSKSLNPEFAKAYTASTVKHFDTHLGVPGFSEYLEKMIFQDGLPRLLHYADRNTMAFSLEGRLPYLDHRLVEFCLGLPNNWKIRGGISKFILRKAVEPLLPPEVVWRKDKKGFPTPIGKWFRATKDQLRDSLSSGAIHRRGILNNIVVQKTINDHLAGKNDHSWEIWRWVVLEVWYRQFIDSNFSKHR